MGDYPRLHDIICNCEDCWWWPIEDKIAAKHADDSNGSWLGPMFIIGPLFYLSAYALYCYLF